MDRPTLKSAGEIQRDNLISELDALRENLVTMWTPEELIEWLWAPHPLLNNKTPMFTIASGQCWKVSEILNQLAEGNFG